KGVIPEFGGRLFIQTGRVVGLHRLGEFADLLPAHHPAVGVVPHHSEDVGIDRHRYANFAAAMARPKIFLPPVVAVIAIVTDLSSGSTDFTRPVNTISAPLPSLGTGTTAVNRTLYSVTAPGSPTHEVTKPPPRPMVNMPCAITVSSPTILAISSSQWIGFRSPETPA